VSIKLLKNLIFLFAINIIIKPLWTFGIDIPAQNYFGQEVFGKYASLMSLSIIFQIILDLGLQTYQSRQVGSNNSSISWLFPNTIVSKAALSIIYLGVLLVIGIFLNYTTYELGLLFLLGVAQIANSLMLYIRASISSLHYYAVDSTLSIVDKSIVILICGSMLYGYWTVDFKIEHLIYAQIIGYSLGAVIGWFFIINKTSLRWSSIQLNVVKRVIKKSIPYALMILSMAVFFRVDIVILEKLTQSHAPEEAGHYWSVYRLLDMLNNFSGILFAGLYLPMVMKNKKNKAPLLDLTHTGLSILLPISVSICVLAYFFHADIMHLLYKTWEGDTFLLFIMMLSFPFYSLNYIYSTLLSGLGEIKSQTIHALICAGIIIVLNLLLDKEMGAMSAAMASIFGHCTFFILNYRRIHNHYHLSVLPQRFIQKMTLFTLLVIVSLYYLQMSEMSLIVAISLTILISMVLLIGLKIVNLKQSIDLLKSRS